MLIKLSTDRTNNINILIVDVFSFIEILVKCKNGDTRHNIANDDTCILVIH